MKKKAKKQIPKRKNELTLPFFSWALLLLIPDQFVSSPAKKKHLKTFSNHQHFTSHRIAALVWGSMTFATFFSFFFYSAGPSPLDLFAAEKANVVSTANSVIQFDNPDNYEFDSNKLDVKNGIVRLRKADQVDNDDDPEYGFNAGTFLDTKYTEQRGLELDSRGLDVGKGEYISRIFDSGTSVEWSGLSWLSDRPYGLNLPDNQLKETGFQQGNMNMTDNVLLYHFDGDAKPKIIDSSGNHNDGNYSGEFLNPFGVVNDGLGFSGRNDRLRVTIQSEQKEALPYQDRSVMFWFKPDVTNTKQVIFQQGNELSGWIIYLEGSRLYSGVWNIDESKYDPDQNGVIWGSFVSSSSTAIQPSIWHHVAIRLTKASATTNGSFELFLDGAIVGKTSVKELTIAKDQIHIGRSGNRTRFHDGYLPSAFAFDGTIDELAIFSRSLSNQEVVDASKRGIGKVMFQVRSCDDPRCIMDQFKGPGGEQDGYFVQTAAEKSSTEALAMQFEKNEARYFQYKVVIESISKTSSPQIREVVVLPSHYDASSPFIANKDGIPNQLVQGFYEIAGSTGKIGYQISHNGNDFYFVNNGYWVWALNPNQTSDALTVNQYLEDFFRAHRNASLYFRAYLKSPSAIDPVELKGLAFSDDAKRELQINVKTQSPKVTVVKPGKTSGSVSTKSTGASAVNESETFVNSSTFKLITQPKVDGLEDVIVQDIETAPALRVGRLEQVGQRESQNEFVNPIFFFVTSVGAGLLLCGLYSLYMFEVKRIMKRKRA